jgi:fucose 4-O-acetylase-like acetyltransferase
MPERIAWVDIYKGLAIIFVVIGHTAAPIGSYIYLFHVAAFFFISGYTTSLHKSGLGRFALNRGTTLLLPFFGVNLLFILLRRQLHRTPFEALFFKNGFTDEQVRAALAALGKLGSYVDLAGATWFLVVLFFTAVLAKLIHDLSRKTPFPEAVAWAATLGLAALSFRCYGRHLLLPGDLDLCGPALFCFMAGQFFRKHDVFQSQINHVYAAPLAVFFMYFYTHVYWAGVVWPLRQFGHPANMLAASGAGIYLTYLVSAGLARVKPISASLSYVGSRTLAVVLFHFLAFKLCYGLFYWLKIAPLGQMQELVPAPNNGYWHWLTLLSLLLVLAADYGLAKIPVLSSILLGFKADALVDKIFKPAGGERHA